MSLKKLSLISFFCATVVLFGCKKDTGTSPSVSITSDYNISGSRIMHLSTPLQLIGANAFHVFGAGGSDMNAWHMDIAREFIGNMKETPIAGGVIKDANGAYLYSLQTLADSNRKNNRLTIFCPFGWDGTGSTVFTGTRPTQMSWWSNFQTQLQQWAAHFKDQPDVWIEVWNEPYRYDRADGYTDDIWASDMNQLVSLIRKTGNSNIVLVPCAEQGQDESVLNNKGAAFLNGKANILFDVHAYEKWLLVNNINMGNRLAQLQKNKLPILFGETAPMNAGTLMNPQILLDSAYNRGISICAWVWKHDGTDQDALLTTGGLPNNTNNNNWGTLFKSLAARVRKP